MKNIVNIVLNDFTNDSRVLKISKSLKAMGHSVTVVAMYNEGLSETDNVDGVNVNRIRLESRSWSKVKPVQFIKYVEFLFRAFWRYRKSDYVHCNDLSALPIGLLIKAFGSGVRVVYDCHEYETEMNGLKGVEKKAKKILERSLIRYADEVVTVSESIAKEYSRLYSISQPRLVLNCPAHFDQPKRNFFRETFGIRDDQTIFLYQGGLAKGRGVELVLDAFTGLDSDKNVLVCMGYGPLEGLVAERASNSNTIFYHPAVKPDVLLSFTSSADYGVSFIEDACLSYRYCLPNKMFEYLMAGLPVITSNLDEMKQLVEAEGVGIVAETNTVEGFRKAISASLEQDYSAMQSNVAEARKKYNWETQEKVLEEIYDGF